MSTELAASAKEPEEIFDVVDMEDNVVGQERRSVVHREKLLHRAVHVFVYNAAGQIYLQRRSMTKDTAPGKWGTSCSGHVDSGEEYLTAARRELGEEIGLFELVELEPLFKQTPHKATGYEFVWVYRCFHEGPFTLDPIEVSDGQWIDTKHLEHWIAERPRDFSWSFTYLWQKCQELEG